MALLPATPALAGDWLDLSQHRWSLVAEGGATFTPNVDISGAHQSNATNGWHTVAPDLRAEAWLIAPGALWLGIVAQPLNADFRATLTNPISLNGQTLQKGQPATLNFQFPSIRATANYPVWSEGGMELRLGGSLIARYAAGWGWPSCARLPCSVAAEATQGGGASFVLALSH